MVALVLQGQCKVHFGNEPTLTNSDNNKAVTQSLLGNLSLIAW